MDLTNQEVLPDFVEVKRRRVKNMRMQIDSQGVVTLIVPQKMSEREAHGWFWHKKAWVDRKRAEIAALEQAVEPLKPDQILLHGEALRWLLSEPASQQGLQPLIWGYLDPPNQRLHSPVDLSDPVTRRQWYLAYAADTIPKRLRQLANETQLPVNRVSIRDQKTRWGSCSSKHNISLNWRLVQMPPNVADYVMLHELAHTKHMNHGPQFWALLEEIHGDYSAEVAWLKTQGRVLRQFDASPCDPSICDPNISDKAP